MYHKKGCSDRGIVFPSAKMRYMWQRNIYFIKIIRNRTKKFKKIHQKLNFLIYISGCFMYNFFSFAETAQGFLRKNL